MSRAYARAPRGSRQPEVMTGRRASAGIFGATWVVEPRGVGFFGCPQFGDLVATLDPPGGVGDEAGLPEPDPRQRTALHPLVQDGLRPRAVDALAMVELLDELGEHATALRRIGDHGGHRRQIGGDTVIEVKDAREWQPQVASSAPPTPSSAAA
jgi:hypothetical protein